MLPFKKPCGVSFERGRIALLVRMSFSDIRLIYRCSRYRQNLRGPKISFNQLCGMYSKIMRRVISFRYAFLRGATLDMRTKSCHGVDIVYLPESVANRLQRNVFRLHQHFTWSKNYIRTNYPTRSITYAENILGSRTWRKMERAKLLWGRTLYQACSCRTKLMLVPSTITSYTTELMSCYLQANVLHFAKPILPAV